MVHARAIDAKRGSLSPSWRTALKMTSSPTFVPSSPRTQPPEWALTLEEVDGLTCVYRLTDIASSGLRTAVVHVVGCVLPVSEISLDLSEGSALVTVVRRREGTSHLPPALTVAWIGVDGRTQTWHRELP